MDTITITGGATSNYGFIFDNMCIQVCLALMPQIFPLCCTQTNIIKSTIKGHACPVINVVALVVNSLLPAAMLE